MLHRLNREHYLVLIDQALVSGVSLLTAVILAKSLGINLFGVWSVVVLTQIFLTAIQQAVISSVYQVNCYKIPLHRRYAYRSVLILLQLSLTVLFGFMPLLLNLFYNHFWGYHIENLPLTVFIIGGLLQDFVRRILLTDNKIFIVTMLDLGTGLSQLIILLYYIETHQLTLTSSLWIIGGTFIPTFLAGLIILGRIKFKANEFRYYTLMHIRQGKWLLLSTLLQWCSGNFFIISSGALLGSVTLGVIRISQSIFGVFNVILQAVETYFLPRASKIAEEKEKLNHLLSNVLLLLLIVFIPFITIILISKNYILEYFVGKESLEYSSILVGFSLVYLITIYGYPIRIGIKSLMMNQKFFIGYCISAIFSLLSAFWMIEKFSEIGIILGLSLSNLLPLVFWSYQLNNQNVNIWKSFISYSVKRIL